MPDPADGDLEARVRDREHEVLRLKDGVEISRADAAAPVCSPVGPTATCRT
jgi:hypothetical protein